MNYLYKNRDNSLYLPFDVMNIIYEYADPMIKIRKQIINKEYNLDDIMYKRILIEIKKRFSRGLGYYIDFYEILPNDIYNEIHKNPILLHHKHHILYYERYRRRICGLDTRYNFYCQRTKIIMDLKANGIKINNRYSTKQLYKKWLKLS
jgi:hypothetical protein